MRLVASQLPLTREPRKECGARDSVTFARVVRAELFGAVGGDKGGRASKHRYTLYEKIKWERRV